jgi:hypothetical protein
MRKSFRWLEKAVTYVDGTKSPINHRFDLGHGLAFESPRFGRGSVTQHTKNMLGFPVVDEVNIYYEIAAAKPLAAHVTAVDAEIVKAQLEAANLSFTCKRVVDADGIVRKCVMTVPPSIPAAVIFRADYKTGIVTLTLINADRFDRVSLAFKSNSIRETLLEDVMKFILGIDSALLRRGPLAGIHGQARG